MNEEWGMQSVSMRNAAAAACSLLIAFIGIAHEGVGSTLYPHGPALLGGPMVWHAGGLAMVLSGAVLFAAALGLIRAPVRSIAAIVSAAGFAIAVLALVRGRFHLFATALLLSGGAVALLYRAPPDRP